MKKFLIILFVFVFSIPSVFAQEFALTLPTLDEQLKKNEQQLRELMQREELSKKSPVKDPILQDDFVFNTVYSGSSIVIKKAEFANFFIQEVDISLGAKIDSALEVVSYNSITGEPQFIKKNMTETLASLQKEPLSLINGQFFNPNKNPSELSFALKTGGIIRTAGAEVDDHAKKSLLHIADGYAEILPYSWKNLEKTTWSFAMANLTLSSPRRKNDSIGRTYFCLKNPNKNKSNVVSFFFADAITEPRIEAQMWKYGCNRSTSAKMDGSGSSRFWFLDNFAHYGNNTASGVDRRKIPHSLLFYEQ